MLPSPFQAEDPGHYIASAPFDEEAALALATDIARRHFDRGQPLTSPDLSRQYLIPLLSCREREVFVVVFADNRHRVIACEELFQGTIDGATVHPREVVKAALRHNAAAVILAHNHPSGVPEPSTADRRITERLVEALKLVDVRVLDHLVVGGCEAVSLAERGWV